MFQLNQTYLLSTESKSGNHLYREKFHCSFGMVYELNDISGKLVSYLANDNKFFSILSF